MEILNYENINNCFICGSTYKNIESFLKKVSNSLTIKQEETIHPKELERQERIKERERERNRGIDQEAVVNRNHPRPSLFRAKPLDKRNGFNLYNDSVLIVSGNGGIGLKSINFYQSMFANYNEILNKNNCHILFVRGNNDNPSYFEEDLLHFSNIKCVKDYTVVKFKNYNCLCIGGAFSIDRNWKIEQGKRLNKKMYWENERLVYDEKKLDEIVNNVNISFIVSCVSPSFSFPGTNNFIHSKWIKNHNDVLNELTNERQIMDKVYDKLIKETSKPYAWFYGKFELNGRSVINDIVFDSLSNEKIVSFNQIISEYFNISTEKNLKKNESSLDNIIKELYGNNFLKVVDNVEEDEDDFIDEGPEPIGQEPIQNAFNMDAIMGEAVNEPIENQAIVANGIGNAIIEDAPINQVIENRVGRILNEEVLQPQGIQWQAYHAPF